MRETVGIVVFSAFMLLVVGMVVGNLLLALYRERRKRKAGIRSSGGPLED
jgi:uncharacterized membrane protein YhiD involved in acid resistance